MEIHFGAGGRVFRGTTPIARVETWRIDQGGGSESDWGGGLTAVWDARPELGTVTLELADGPRTWRGAATITDLPFRLPPDRKAEIGFQGSGPLQRA